MGRLRGLVIALCLLLPACAGAHSSVTAAACDYADFIRLRGVTVRPSSGRAEQRYCFVVFNLADGTAVRRAFFPATGELMPGVFAPPAFTEAVEGALEARQRTCGRSP